MAMFPKGSSKGPATTPPPTDPILGTLVQYDDEATVVLAAVIGSKKDKLQVLNERGRELDLAKARLYQLPGKIELGPTTAVRTSAITAMVGKFEAAAAEIDVAEVWSFVCEEPRLFTIKELSENYFGADSLERHAALRIAIIKDRVHFKRDKEGFEPRPVDIVENLLRAEDAKKKKAALREETLSFAVQRINQRDLPIPREIEENFKLLAEIAAGVTHTDPARQKEGRELVAQCGERLHIPEAGNLEKRAFEVLTKTGYFHRDTNLSFIRHHIQTEYSAEVLAEAESRTAPDSLEQYDEQERSIRRDLTGEHAFTIDDESTQDMDDALSVHQTQDGFELGIHITDVTVSIVPETKLDIAARRRAISIYCADQTVNMLPEELSESKLSLIKGAVRPCISVLATFTSDHRLVRTEVIPSFIRIAERLSYEEVDRRLEEGDHILLTVHEIAAALEEARLRDGAVKVQKREVVPFLEEDGSIRLLEIEEDSPARSLVAEMMVLANTTMATFAAEHDIPVLYRGQERPDPETQDGNDNVPEGPAKDFLARTKLKKSTVSLEPQYHAGLAISHYIQATSPIRRYMDLCHQRQFISYFKTSKPWLKREELEPLAFEVENYLQNASLASRETKRYWLLRYLEKRNRKQPITGTVVRIDGKAPLVELDEVYMTVFVRLPKAPKLGDVVTLKITAIDPHSDYIRLELAPIS